MDLRVTFFSYICYTFKLTKTRIVCKDYELQKQSLETNGENPENPVFPGMSTNAVLKRMQHKISYMEQQIEFIKKTILAERGKKRL